MTLLPAMANVPGNFRPLDCPKNPLALTTTADWLRSPPGAQFQFYFGVGYWLSAIGHLLDPRAIWYDGVLWDHDYSVAHVKMLRIQIGGLAIRGDYYPLADPGVFVDDCAIDD